MQVLSGTVKSFPLHCNFAFHAGTTVRMLFFFLLERCKGVPSRMALHSLLSSLHSLPKRLSKLPINGPVWSHLPDSFDSLKDLLIARDCPDSSTLSAPSLIDIHRLAIVLFFTSCSPCECIYGKNTHRSFSRVHMFHGWTRQREIRYAEERPLRNNQSPWLCCLTATSTLILRSSLGFTDQIRKWSPALHERAWSMLGSKIA